MKNFPRCARLRVSVRRLETRDYKSQNFEIGSESCRLQTTCLVVSRLLPADLVQDVCPNSAKKEWQRICHVIMCKRNFVRKSRMATVRFSTRAPRREIHSSCLNSRSLDDQFYFGRPELRIGKFGTLGPRCDRIRRRRRRAPARHRGRGWTLRLRRR